MHRMNQLSGLRTGKAEQGFGPVSQDFAAMHGYAGRLVYCQQCFITVKNEFGIQAFTVTKKTRLSPGLKSVVMP
jgi:hypothetical protein